jgi:hypothetical protein
VPTQLGFGAMSCSSGVQSWQVSSVFPDPLIISRLEFRCAEEVIELGKQSQELDMVLLDCNLRTKLLDAVTFPLVHADRKYYRIHCRKYVR